MNNALMKNKKGFTLMEIIVVLIIIAILAAVAIPSMVRYVQEARAKAYTAEARLGMVAAQAVITEWIASGPNRDVENSATNVWQGARLTDDGYVEDFVLEHDSRPMAAGTPANRSKFERMLQGDVEVDLARPGEGFRGLRVGDFAANDTPDSKRVTGIVYHVGRYQITIRDNEVTEILVNGNPI